MKISYNWLKDYLNLKHDPNTISDILTDIGLEVEGIQNFTNIQGGLKGVVIGEVLEKVKHPNADKLSLTQVDIGSEKIQIVCGAPNVNVGQKVPVATIGTILYNNDEKFKIKKGKIRGEYSFGMICSEQELNLGNDNAGIMVLDDNIDNGTLASDYFNIEEDYIFEIGLTPNRTDAMCHIGVARDLMAALNNKGENLKIHIPKVKNLNFSETSNSINVDVKDSTLCPRYSGLIISNITVGESPNWLKSKLRAIGISPTNNVVDITNFVLHEMGQPLHAFDLNNIDGDKIIVSTVKEDTKFITLDGIERLINKDDLMINSKSKPMCIAGVYGGKNSSVSSKTTDIFLESAYFNPVSIRKSSKRHLLNTDASFRYERGCDPSITVFALKRAAFLVQEICGGNISSEIIDIYPKEIKKSNVILNFNNVNKVAGHEIDPVTIKKILFDLEINIVNDFKNSLELNIPLYRVDVTREIDVIEEIFRIYGYNNINIPNKLSAIIPLNKINKNEDYRNLISNFLSNNGFNETMNNSLSSSEYHYYNDDICIDNNVNIINPLSKDLNVMRQSLLFGGLENINFNHNRKNLNLKLYEFGKTYHKEGDKYKEIRNLQIICTGNIMEDNWNSTAKNIDFFYLKQIVQHILNKISITKYNSTDINNSIYLQAVNFSHQKDVIVNFGELNSKLCSHFGIKTKVFHANFYWDNILKYINKDNIKFSQISKFPDVKRDLSLLINDNISFEELKKLAFSLKSDIIKSVNLFDVYQGKNIPNGKKSYSLSFILSDNTKTLTDHVIDKTMNNLIDLYKLKLSAEIR